VGFWPSSPIQNRFLRVIEVAQAAVRVILFPHQLETGGDCIKNLLSSR
jgi:hypothetical protein